MQTLSRLIGPKPFKYSTFISFRGLDTRCGFSGFLNKYLVDRGFRTFFDEVEIEIGTRIRQRIPKAIEESRIFIPVLSENYASSSFCLDELVKILDEFKKGNGRSIFPVFYYVNISDVKNQTGSYGKALAVHKNRGVMPARFQKWIDALTSVADFRGCHMERARGIFEFQYIYEIIQEVSKHVACSIGLDHRVEKVMRCLTSGSDNDRVCVVGICGVPGIGKTTLARGVYHFHGSIEFDCYWFFDNVGEYLNKHGLVHLQQMLLSEIVGHNNSTLFESVDEGMSTTIKHKLNQKKVFLILEDVHDSEALKAIVRLTTFFGFGSRVIITTRERCFLQLHGIKRIYEVERMNKVEAFQMLNLKAFDSMNVSPCYVAILEGLETYASGHPFILEVIGSYLSGKTLEECEFALLQYKQIPNGDIKKILQVSFDALEKMQQNILIHIALHIREKELAMVEDLLHCKYGVCQKDDTRVLLKKSLIKINENGQVIVHGLTQEMVKDNVPPEDLS